MKHFATIEKRDTATPHFGICPRCNEEQFLSVPMLAYGMICLYCLHDLYPPNGLPRPQQRGVMARTPSRRARKRHQSAAWPTTLPFRLHAVRALRL